MTPHKMHCYRSMLTSNPTKTNCPSKRHVSRGLDRMSRGLNVKIPIHIAEGNLRPEAPIQAAKLAAEAGIILRDNIPVLPHWKDYKKDEGLVQNYVGKIASQFTIDTTSKAVKAACSDLLKKGQRQLRYYLKKKYFNGIPTDKVRTTSPVSTMSDLQWKKLVEMWSTARHKERCLKNKESREKVCLQQTTGSRCYVAQLFVARQTKYKDSPPTAIDHFKDTHCSSKKGFSENAKNAIDEMEAIVAEPQDGENPKTLVEAVVQVMPKSTFLQNVGLGSAVLKRSVKPAARDDRVQELQLELQAEKQGSAELREKVEYLEAEAVQHRKETEKLKQQGDEIQSFLKSFGSLFAGSVAPSFGVVE